MGSYPVLFDTEIARAIVRELSELDAIEAQLQRTRRGLLHVYRRARDTGETVRSVSEKERVFFQRIDNLERDRTRALTRLVFALRAVQMDVEEIAGSPLGRAAVDYGRRHGKN